MTNILFPACFALLLFVSHNFPYNSLIIDTGHLSTPAPPSVRFPEASPPRAPAHHTGQRSPALQPEALAGDRNEKQTLAFGHIRRQAGTKGTCVSGCLVCVYVCMYIHVCMVIHGFMYVDAQRETKN